MSKVQPFVIITIVHTAAGYVYIHTRVCVCVFLYRISFVSFLQTKNNSIKLINFPQFHLNQCHLAFIEYICCCFVTSISSHLMLLLFWFWNGIANCFFSLLNKLRRCYWNTTICTIELNFSKSIILMSIKDWLFNLFVISSGCVKGYSKISYSNCDCYNVGFTIPMLLLYQMILAHGCLIWLLSC